MNTTVAIIVGIIIGFVLEWIVDFFLLRKKTRRLEYELGEARREKAVLEQELSPQEKELDAGEIEAEELPSRAGEPVEIEAEQIDFETSEVLATTEEPVEEAQPTEEEAEGLASGSGMAVAGLVAAAELMDRDEPEESDDLIAEEGTDNIFIPGEESTEETAQETEIRPGDDTEWIFEESIPEETTASTELEGAKFKQDIEFVEGIGPAYGARLREIGIETPQDLLEKGATAKGRDEIVSQSGIPNSLVLGWVNQVDLYRIKGIGSEYAELLETAGVDTVLELANRNPQNLHKKLVEVNSEFQRVRQVPSLGQVNDWVEQAKSLPRIVSY